MTSTRGLAAVPLSPIGCEVGPLMIVLVSASGIWKPGRCLELFVTVLLGIHCHEGLYFVSNGVWVGDPCQVDLRFLNRTLPCHITSSHSVENCLVFH